jgi:membrane-associated phospholipid phosphatase
MVTVTLSVAAAGPGTLPGDANLLQAIQSLHFEPLDLLARITNVIATGGVLTTAMLLSALVFRFRGHCEAAYVMVAATALRAVNPLLKTLIASPRPSASAATISETASGFGFPSGHTMGAVLALGTVAVMVPTLTNSRRINHLIQLGAIAGVATTGYGRLMTGAHWPSDVAGGVCWGLLLLTVARWFGHRLAIHVAHAKEPAPTQ